MMISQIYSGKDNRKLLLQIKNLTSEQYLTWKQNSDNSPLDPIKSQFMAELYQIILRVYFNLKNNDQIFNQSIEKKELLAKVELLQYSILKYLKGMYFEENAIIFSYKELWTKVLEIMWGEYLQNSHATLKLLFQLKNEKKLHPEVSEMLNQIWIVDLPDQESKIFSSEESDFSFEQMKRREKKIKDKNHQFALIVKKKPTKRNSFNLSSILYEKYNNNNRMRQRLSQIPQLLGRQVLIKNYDKVFYKSINPPFIDLI